LERVRGANSLAVFTTRDASKLNAVALVAPVEPALESLRFAVFISKIPLKTRLSIFALINPVVVFEVLVFSISPYNSLITSKPAPSVMNVGF